MEYDAKTKQFTQLAVAGQAITANGSDEGIIIDTQGFESITFSMVINALTSTAGTITLSLEDGDEATMSDAASVLVTDDPKTLVGTFKGLDTALQINRVGYIGKKRYVRASIDTTAASALVANAAVIAILGNAHGGPTVDQ